MQLLSDLKTVKVKVCERSTNIVYVYLNDVNQKPAYDYVAEFEAKGILLLANAVAFRLVFHSAMSHEDVFKITAAFKQIIQ